MALLGNQNPKKKKRFGKRNGVGNAFNISGGTRGVFDRIRLKPGMGGGIKKRVQQQAIGIWSQRNNKCALSVGDLQQQQQQEHQKIVQNGVRGFLRGATQLLCQSELYTPPPRHPLPPPPPPLPRLPAPIQKKEKMISNVFQGKAQLNYTIFGA
ncbi:hypothetical protein RUM43_009244 [Polyplax serrata]|uniref:Uncharacterized protein n=1 Tax=Polyplax serrata TaxID=468196 RepID=A0AAN8PCH4_POLSC